MKREKGHADLVPPNQNGPFYFDPLQGGSPKDQFIAAQSWEETNKIGPDEASERASSEQESARENQFREYVKDLVRDAGAVLRKTEQIARAPQAWKRTNVEALRSELKEFETRSKEAAPTKDEVEELKAKVRQLEEELKEVEERQMSTWTKMNPFGGTQREKFEQEVAPLFQQIQQAHTPTKAGRALVTGWGPETLRQANENSDRSVRLGSLFAH